MPKSYINTRRFYFLLIIVGDYCVYLVIWVSVIWDILSWWVWLVNWVIYCGLSGFCFSGTAEARKTRVWRKVYYVNLIFWLGIWPCYLLIATGLIRKSNLLNTKGVCRNDLSSRYVRYLSSLWPREVSVIFIPKGF